MKSQIKNLFVALALLALPNLNSQLSTAHAQSAQPIFMFPSSPLNPQAALTLGPDGNFYGTTYQGGSSGGGTVFCVTTNGTLTTLVNFAKTNGANPQAALTPGPDGNFYGTTPYGGSSGDGTVFCVTTNGNLTTLVNFANTNGASPQAALSLGPDGNFYGTTPNGGSSGNGTVFCVTTNGTLTTLVNFAYTNGAYPSAALTLGPDANFYGTTFYGGSSGGGTVFCMTTNGTLTTLVTFAYINGASPHANLTLGPDGNFYGTTFDGGSSGIGVIYRLNLPPEILSGLPGIQKVASGSNVDFSVRLFGTAPFSWLWLSNGVPVAGATNSSLLLSNVTAASDAAYNVIVSNPWGSVASSVAELVVGPGVGDAPTITNRPASQTVIIGGTAHFSIGASGSPPLDYQWFFNRITLLTAATNAGLAIAPAITNDDGDYQVVVSNLFGCVTSTAASLTVVAEPNIWGISNDPTSGSIALSLAGVPGSTNWLRATTNLSAPFLQWQVIATNVAGPDGLFQFIDPKTQKVPERFYRLSDTLNRP